MDHARAGEVGLGEEAGHAGQVHAGGRVHVGVPGDARVGGPGHVALALVTWGAAPGHAGGADVLLVVGVPGQLLEQEVVQAVLRHQALQPHRYKEKVCNMYLKNDNRNRYNFCDL